MKRPGPHLIPVLAAWASAGLLMAAAAPPQLTEADVRAFIARQEQAWNAGRLDAYFAGFTSDARFTDQAYQGDKPPVPYGTATLAQAQAQSSKAFRGAGRSTEAGQILRIVIAPDGRSASVESRVVSQLKTRRLCATRVQAIVATPGGVRSRGQTDTLSRCRP